GDQARGGEAARLIVTATTDQLTGVPGAGQASCETTRRGLGTTALQHLACTALLHTVTLSCQGGSAAVLALGRSVRLFSPAQRRAMLARDGGCVIPGCTSPPGWWEAHHTHAWGHGGPT
ncbi:HNH endonuclease signature motif containing protein, partial [Quadrisphaera oryzae]